MVRRDGVIVTPARAGVDGGLTQSADVVTKAVGLPRDGMRIGQAESASEMISASVAEPTETVSLDILEAPDPDLRTRGTSSTNSGAQRRWTGRGPLRPRS